MRTRRPLFFIVMVTLAALLLVVMLRRGSTESSDRSSATGLTEDHGHRRLRASGASVSDGEASSDDEESQAGHEGASGRLYDPGALPLYLFAEDFFNAPEYFGVWCQSFGWAKEVSVSADKVLAKPGNSLELISAMEEAKRTTDEQLDSPWARPCLMVYPAVVK